MSSTDFWVAEGIPNLPIIHIAFRAENQKQVDEFYKAAKNTVEFYRSAKGEAYMNSYLSILFAMSVGVSSFAEGRNLNTNVTSTSVTLAAKDSAGQYLFMSYEMAVRYCSDRGTRLPTIREYADLAISQGALGYRQTAYPGKKIDDPSVHAEIYRNINTGYNYYVKSADDTIDFYYSNQGFHYGQDAFVIEQSWVQDGEVGATGVYYNYYDRDGSITVVDPRTYAAVHCVGSENPPAPIDPAKTYTAGVTGAVFTKVNVPGWKYAWQDPDGTIWGNYLGDFSNTPLGSESTNQILDSDAVRACKSLGGTVPSLEDYRRLNSYLDTYAYCSYNLSTQGNHDMKALFPDFDGHYFWSSTSAFTNAINQGSLPDEALGIQGYYDPNASAEFAQGAIYSKPRSEHQAVRCIRKLP